MTVHRCMLTGAKGCLSPLLGSRYAIKEQEDSRKSPQLGGGVFSTGGTALLFADQQVQQ